MLMSLMVFPDNNNFFNVTNPQNENVVKLIQQSATPSPQQQNMHFVVSPMLVGNLSTPSSPSYPTIKTEEGLSHSLDYNFMYSPFDMHSSTSQQQPHILPSQRSPHGLTSHQQQRLMSYEQQNQMRLQQQQRAIEQHQYQQYHHSQQQQQQLLYDPTPATSGRPAITSAMSMSMPLSVSVPMTSGPSSLMINSPTVPSSNIFTPVFSVTHHPQSSLSKDDASTTMSHNMSTAAMMASLQSQHPKRSYSISAEPDAADVAHPVSPKRQRHDSGHQQHHALAQLSPSSIDISDFSRALSPQGAIATAALSTNTGTTAGVTSATMAMSSGVGKRPRRSSTSSSRTSTGSHLDMAADLRAVKAMRTSTTSSAIDSKRTSGRLDKGSVMVTAQIPNTLHHHAFHPSQPHAQMQLSQPVDYTQAHMVHNYARPPGSSNVTHPRRAAQNRAAQRTFRNRRKAYIKDMEQKVLELNETRTRFGIIQKENKEIWERYRALENLILENGLSIPTSFKQMTPFFETEAGIAAAAASQAALSGTVTTSAPGTVSGSVSGSAIVDGEGQAQSYKQSSSEGSDGGDQDDDGEHEFDNAYTITSSPQRQQQQRQRVDGRGQDLDIRRP
ncbi:hypothetical protein BGZ80_002431 [Entomortierella chlamydospora]|uniref:BZIP domain-containing protein n=1 Tax=Entomortierella chlamydospora TaxID=101097 RepID=A0A9P6T4L9_9FUNG|nr:hypothetical protein BGZ80_002431 [Entomortierella chlamydospora]